MHEPRTGGVHEAAVGEVVAADVAVVEALGTVEELLLQGIATSKDHPLQAPASRERWAIVP